MKIELNSESISFPIGILLAAILGGLLGVFMCDHKWEKYAIDHGHAIYNPTNANFTWISMTNQ